MKNETAIIIFKSGHKLVSRDDLTYWIRRLTIEGNDIELVLVGEPFDFQPIVHAVKLENFREIHAYLEDRDRKLYESLKKRFEPQN